MWNRNWRSTWISFQRWWAWTGNIYLNNRCTWFICHSTVTQHRYAWNKSWAEWRISGQCSQVSISVETFSLGNIMVLEVEVEEGPKYSSRSPTCLVDNWYIFFQPLHRHNLYTSQFYCIYNTEPCRKVQYVLDWSTSIQHSNCRLMRLWDSHVQNLRISCTHCYSR